VILTVPVDTVLYPTLGPAVCAFIEERLVFGPGDLRGQPAVLDDEKRALVYRMYEIYPQGHPLAGRRRFKRAGLSLPKGLAKTELAAWIAICELHPEAPVRCLGWTEDGEPIGGPVTDPYIPLVAYTEEQSDELAYGAMRVIIEEGPCAKDFDVGLERIQRINGDGKAVSLSSSPNARDGARTTFCVMDEPLAIDTPVMTTEGWKTMGSIVDGDYVYGRDGHPVRVLGGSDVHEGRPCFRVTLSDGDTIVTDERHRWKAMSSSNPGVERVVTTLEMFEAGTDTPHGKRWRLPRASGYDGVTQDLPIDPYVLGLWLGDGDARNATIAVGEADLVDTRRQIEACGYVVTQCVTGEGRTPMLYVTVPDARHSGWAVAQGGQSSARSLVGQLRHLHLLTNKHIPAVYMLADRSQRLALLQGLMDADGYTNSTGTCTFVQGRHALAERVCDLVRSLGTPARICQRKDERSRTGYTYKVHFTPKYSPFRLPRKAARCPGRSLACERWPLVVSIERCESVPVRCIAVDSDDHLFLAGRGLRLTHNTHWWTLPRLKQAHQTMQNNLAKRKLADPWMLETTTAPEPGTGSVAEATMDYAKAVDDGHITDSALFFFHRQASDSHDLTTPDGVRAAIIEASGPAAAWRDIDAIAGLWADPTTDKAYLERVWCNRLVKGATQAFDVVRWQELTRPSPVQPGDLIVLGFDGAMFFDSTALVATHVETGFQWLLGLWERPKLLPTDQTWQVPAHDVDRAVRDAFEVYDVWRMYADPAYWQSWLATWRGAFGDERVIEWLTTRRLQMARAIEGFTTAIATGTLSHEGHKDVTRHIANARREDLKGYRDEQGRPLCLIRKERPDSPLKMDAAMASILSWEARTDAIAAGAHSVMAAGSVEAWIA